MNGLSDEKRETLRLLCEELVAARKVYKEVRSTRWLYYERSNPETLAMLTPEISDRIMENAAVIRAAHAEQEKLWKEACSLADAHMKTVESMIRAITGWTHISQH